MAREAQLQRYRRWYAALLRLYPEAFRERFGESMEQTFADACRARASAGREVHGVALWLSAETISGLIHEHMERLSMRQNSIIRAAVVTAGVLLVPLWGTFYIDGWNWPWQAFARIGAFVFAAALAYQLSVKGMSNKAYRVALGLAVTTAVVLTWMNFVIATSGSLANFTYFGVVLVGIAGAARNGDGPGWRGNRPVARPLHRAAFLEARGRRGTGRPSRRCERSVHRALRHLRAAVPPRGAGA